MKLSKLQTNCFLNYSILTILTILFITRILFRFMDTLNTIARKRNCLWDKQKVQWKFVIITPYCRIELQHGSWWRTMTEAKRVIASGGEQITAHWLIGYASLCKSPNGSVSPSSTSHSILFVDDDAPFTRHAHAKCKERPTCSFIDTMPATATNSVTVIMKGVHVFLLLCDITKKSFRIYTILWIYFEIPGIYRVNIKQL